MCAACEALARSEMLLQIHDELLLETPDDPSLQRHVAHTLRSTLEADVPAVVAFLGQFAFPGASRVPLGREERDPTGWLDLPSLRLYFPPRIDPLDRPETVPGAMPNASPLLGGSARLRVPLTVKVSFGSDYGSMQTFPDLDEPPGGRSLGVADVDVRGHGARAYGGSEEAEKGASRALEETVSRSAPEPSSLATSSEFAIGSIPMLSAVAVPPRQSEEELASAHLEFPSWEEE